MRVPPRLSPTIGRVAGLIVWLAGSGVAAAAAADDPPLNPMRALERTALKGFLEKPLFDPARRLPPVEPPPPIVEAPVVAVAPPPPPNLHLIGVIHGLRDIAIVHRDNDEKTVILHTGDLVDGWTVTVVPPVGVRLKSGERVFDYAIFAKSGTSVGSVAAAPTPDFPNTASLSAVETRNARLRRRTY